MCNAIRFLSVLGFSATCVHADWNNLSGNNARNGQADVVGPAAEDLLWDNTDDFSLITWAPFVLGDHVYTIRESGFPQNGGAANDALLCYDLNDGHEVWRTTLPFGGNTSKEWIAWIAGARDGRVYGSRSAHLTPAVMRAYDAETGVELWHSEATTESFAYDGVVFAPDGDLIVGDWITLYRIDAETGDTVWTTPRLCSVSGNCGAAANDTAVFIDQPVVGGQVITKIDIESGDIVYSSPVMAGFTEQNQPFLSADGTTAFLSRTQNNTLVDFLFAFQDTGSEFIQMWSVPVRWTTSAGHGIGPDGTIYTFTQLDEFVGLDPLTGVISYNAGTLSPLGGPNLSQQTAVDADGTVYVSNGWANTPTTNGRMWAFSPDLTTNLFTLELDNQNQGGPALGQDGTLIINDRFGVYAYRSPVTPCDGDANNDGAVDPLDAGYVLSRLGCLVGTGDPLCDEADVNLDTLVDPLDVGYVLSRFGACP